jgi:lysophospholipase
MKFLGLVLLASVFFAGPASAISEKDYAKNFTNMILPFMKTGEEGTFKTRDGFSLSTVRYVHPNSKGTILVIQGRSESWKKYGEVFYDLYQKGYTLYSYDHRGQGLSPHLVKANPQIGHIDHFSDYVRDLEDYMSIVFNPSVKKGDKFLLAHSMGGGIAAQYLSRGETPFKKAVLNCPMLGINTSPYAVTVAKAITGGSILIGNGEDYARGRGNYDPNESFEKNDVTGSPERWWMTNFVYQMFPATIIGGPSNAWAYKSIVAGPKIAKKMGGITTPIILFQAEHDAIVTPDGENKGCALAKDCTLIKVPGGHHETLMEKDSIRDPAMKTIEAFFQ